MGKVQFQFLNSFLLVLIKFSFWEEDWALGYNCMKIWDVNISLFPKILRQLVRQLVYTMFITNNHYWFHLWWKKNMVKHQIILAKIVVVNDTNSTNNEKSHCFWENCLLWKKKCKKFRKVPRGQADSWKEYQMGRVTAL